MFKRINEIQYHYEVDGIGAPLLLLHGFTGSIENWRPLLPHLTKNFQTITVDFPGHGKTESPTDSLRYGMEPVARDLIELMADLGHDRFNLLGYSMGGRLALYLAVHYLEQVNNLILESASPGLKTAAEREARRMFDNNLADRIEAEGIEQFVAFWESISLWESQAQLTESTRSTIRSIRLANNPVGLANSLRGAGTGQQPSLWPALAKLHLPILLMTGELDTKFCSIAADMRPNLQNATHVVIPHAGHTIHLEKPNLWLEAVQKLLS